MEVACKFNWDLFIKAAGVIVTVLVAGLVYFFTKRNMRNETIERISRFKNEKLMESGMAFWGLLTYITLTENKYAILVWEKEKNTTEKKYYFRPDQAKEFIDKLNTINYEKGYGLFLSRQTRELFYEYRNIVYGILLAEKNNRNDTILLTNTEMVSGMQKIYDKMVESLRKEIDPDKNTLRQD